MEIIKRKSGIKYREMVWVKGIPIKSPMFSRKTDCTQWKAEQLSNKVRMQVHGDVKIHQKILFSEMAEKWIYSKNAASLSRATLKKYNHYCKNHFNPVFGDRDLKTIQKDEVEKFQIHLRSGHNAKGTNSIMTALKAIFKEAVKEGYIYRSPCEFIKKLSTDKIQFRFWTKAEIDQFLKANFNDELYDLVVVALNTGMRKGELAGLCWDRVDFSKNMITVTRTKDDFELKDRTKTNSVRWIPMTEICRATLLKLFQKNVNGSEYVFLDSKGQPIEPHHLSRYIGSLQKKAGIKNVIRFHDLRHTFASQYIMNGGSIYDLQKFLGHTSVLTTQIYAHHSHEYLQSQMSGFQLGFAREMDNSELNFEKFNQNLTILKHRNVEAV